MTGHQRGEGTGQRSALIGVVTVAECHEQGTEVCVAETELTEAAAVLTNLLGGIVGVANDDFLRREHAFDRGLVTLNVEGVIVVEELQQVDAGQVARRVVNVHVLAARVRAVDAGGVRRRVPAVDRGVVLHAGIGALPCCFSELTHDVAGLDGFDDLAGGHGTQVPISVVNDGFMKSSETRTELLAFWYWIGERVFPIEIHVEAVVAKDTRLSLFDDLAPHEILECLGDPR